VGCARPTAEIQEPGGTGGETGGRGGLGDETVKPDGAAETFLERFLATYRFRQSFGPREPDGPHFGPHSPV
jgi:hypothetical protein